jgi:hypothetical protein
MKAPDRLGIAAGELSHGHWARSGESATKARAALTRHCVRLGDGHCPRNVTVATDTKEMSNATYRSWRSPKTKGPRPI